MHGDKDGWMVDGSAWRGCFLCFSSLWGVAEAPARHALQYCTLGDLRVGRAEALGVDGLCSGDQKRLGHRRIGWIGWSAYLAHIRSCLMAVPAGLSLVTGTGTGTGTDTGSVAVAVAVAVS